jgi:hypothetical protein
MKQHVITLSMDQQNNPAVQEIQLATLFEQLAGKEKAQRFLRRMGLDPRQFVLFLELFRTLSAREELIGSVGVNRFNITYLSFWAALMGVYILTFLLMTNTMPSAPVYLLVDLSITFAVTFLVFIRETANSLFNPVEATMLAHTPIHGPTYAAAKIAHIFIAVLYLVLGLNLCPALIGFITQGACWFWFITHLMSAFLIGLWTAFIICAFYGLVRRLVPANLLKSISMWIQLLSMSAFVTIPIYFKSFLTDLFAARFENSQWTWLPLTWFVEIGRMGCQGTTWQLGLQGAWSSIASIIIIWFGLRSFSGTYLSEAASTVVRQSHRKSKSGVRYRHLTALVCVLTGAPVGLGVFCFINQMIRRDRLFRRALLMQAWILLLVTVVAIGAIARFGLFPASHIIPHLLGLISIALCINLPTTAFSNASWIYLTAPIFSARVFARGMWGALWISLVVLPHTALLIFTTLFVNWKEAVFITGFNMIVGSLYLAFGIGMISGLPFSSPVNESRNIVKSIYIQMCGLILMAFPVGVQINLWGAWWYALIVAIAMLFVGWFVLRVNLKGLEREIRWRLHLLKMGPNHLFSEYE